MPDYGANKASHYIACRLGLIKRAINLLTLRLLVHTMLLVRVYVCLYTRISVAACVHVHRPGMSVLWRSPRVLWGIPIVIWRILGVLWRSINMRCFETELSLTGDHVDRSANPRQPLLSASQRWYAHTFAPIIFQWGSKYDFRYSCWLGKHITNWAISPTCPSKL